MHNTKTLGFLAAALGAGSSVAQTFTPAPACASLAAALAGPAAPDEIQSFLDAHETAAPAAGGILRDPEAYVSELCGIAVDLPETLLPEFSGWGADLLSFAGERIVTYDEVVTMCITTGTAAASITSYLHSIVSHPDDLCKPTSTAIPTWGNSTASGTITPYPTATPTGNTTIPGTTSIPVAAAARPTGVLMGAIAMGGIIGAAILL
ncbi:hypothetical protein F5B22DRAFT_598239 [Xylaria bambusicola]|uniref:uncharacterized protein n=1 Tax=Xylaria bambusicola TaxID=326684 RepID=UPI0020075750|nr:uncharacterized protein F5B22DRAFT_598239 [Xylaria bambusicola]KAI0520752.1 hypothetical protein F5B22DRAFT_598239 [Xylaria bambusicola]